MRGRFPRRVAASLLAAACGAAASTVLAQEDLFGRAIVSHQMFGSDNLDSSGVHQTYDLRFQRNVTDPLRLRLSFRGEGNNGTTDLGMFRTDTTYWQLQPGAELTYTLPKIQIHGTYDLYDTRSSFNDLQAKRRFERSTASLNWIPDDFPSLSVQGEERVQKDPFAGIDQSDKVAFESLSLTRPSFTLGQTAHYETLDLNSSGFSRKTSDLQGQGQYQNSFFNGRLSASANAVVGFTRIQDDTKNQAVSVPTRVQPVSALLSHDETPLDSRDVPPISAPALIDGDFAKSAGVPLGPAGMSFENIAIDLQHFVGLDAFRVFVRDSAGNNVKIGGLVRFDVYTSANGLDWTPAPGQAATTFVTTLSAYDVIFVQTTARFFKIVNFGTNSVETFVTEVQVFFHTAFAAGESKRTDLRIVTGTAQVTGRLTNWLTLSYYGLLNDFHTSPQGKAEYGSLDSDQLVTLEGKTLSGLDLTLRYEDRRARTGGGFSESLMGYWATALYAFTPSLSSTVEASRTSDRNAQNITTDTLRFHQYARLYRTFDVYADFGTARQDDVTNKIQSLQTFLTGYSYIQLTRSLRLNLSANLLKTRYEGEGAAALGTLESNNERYYGELYYRPSSRLLLSGRLGYVGGTLVSGTTETYRVEWYPFAGGTIGIGTIYDDDIETNGFSHRFRRIQILPHWQINPHAILDVNYNWLTLTSTVPGQTTKTSTRQFYATLTLTL